MTTSPTYRRSWTPSTGRSISYAIESSPNLELANASLRETSANSKDGQKPPVHSAQGFQYHHRLWRLLLQNADALTAAPQHYIHWYNSERISTKLNGLSPVLYRVLALVA